MRAGGNPSTWEVCSPQKEDGPTSVGIPSPWPAALSTLAWLEASTRTRQGWENSQPMLSSAVRVLSVAIRRKNQTLRDLTRISELKACGREFQTTSTYHLQWDNPINHHVGLGWSVFTHRVEKSTIFLLSFLPLNPSTVSDQWRAQSCSFATSVGYHFPYKHREQHGDQDLQTTGVTSPLSILQGSGPSHSSTFPS